MSSSAPVDSYVLAVRSMVPLGSIPEMAKLCEGAGTARVSLHRGRQWRRGSPGSLRAQGQSPLQVPISLPGGQGVDSFSPGGPSFFQCLGFLKCEQFPVGVFFPDDLHRGG